MLAGLAALLAADTVSVAVGTASVAGDTAFVAVGTVSVAGGAGPGLVALSAWSAAL